MSREYFLSNHILEYKCLTTCNLIPPSFSSTPFPLLLPIPPSLIQQHPTRYTRPNRASRVKGLIKTCQGCRVKVK